MIKFFTRLFGSRNDRLLKNYRKQVRDINALEESLRILPDEQFPAKTQELRERFAASNDLTSLIPEAFALTREAARRALRMRHFDVQLIGGMVLHDGKIAEMRTGEGKTLVATLPAYLNSLTGKSVHIVTVNDYLAGRDAEWMGKVYRFLGLTVGVVRSGQDAQQKREAYQCDVIYGTNNEFGFDYLRDNLAFRAEDRMQRDRAYAIIDEVDSILIDEARTPLIISGPAEDSSDLYLRINKLIPKLVAQQEEEGPGDYSIDEKAKQAYLTEEGLDKVEELMVAEGLLQEGAGLYDPANIRLMHHLHAALRAHALFRREVEYIVRDGEVVIVDEFTGRTMPGRRWSDGLHQAVEAKEGVKVKPENQTVASITFQNYFRLYDKLGGMTGTADTEAFEFSEIYGLEVAVIPTHAPMIRKDLPDVVFLSQEDKFDAIIEEIEECRQRGQPVLVGTTSIETSEFLAGLLKKKQIPHQVLNAKQHEKEAEVVAQAGMPGAVTIATNMAGRGTDIMLGGNLEAELAQLAPEDTEGAERVRADWQQRHTHVLQAGGLHIIGTERHESRRIDNQLRGRSGRQGDPGSSRFYLSMEDNLMRIFGDPARVRAMLSRIGMKKGEALESRMLSRQIERAQRKVEAHNFDIRKNLLEYDDVANDQRKVIYGQRSGLMETDDIGESIANIRYEVVNSAVSRFVARESVEEQWDLAGLETMLEQDFGAKLEVRQWLEADEGIDQDRLRDRIVEELDRLYVEKAQRIGEPAMRQFEKAVMLQQLDLQWREHLAAMDYLRQSIGLRSFAQRNPKQEYKREAFEMFNDLLDRVKLETTKMLCRVKIRDEQEVAALEEQQRQRAAAVAAAMRAQQAQRPPAPAPSVLSNMGGAPVAPMPQPAVRVAAPPAANEVPKAGRNDPCPCGSGKKYKHCHGRLA